MHINITTSPAIFRWKPAAWLRVTGADAASFLQGQFTNDLRPLAQPNCPAVYGLWLSLKGKVLADSFVLRRADGDGFWIGSYFSPATVIRERLESYIIADDVLIADETGAWDAVTSWGDGPPEPRTEGVMVFPGRRDRTVAWESVFPQGLAPGWLAAAEEQRIEAEEVERRRIAAGVPAVPVDVGPADLPNEGGLDVDAVSFNKGCYLGQEVMARLKAMGQVRRRLVRVSGKGAPPPARPTALFGGDRQIGDLRSAVADGAGGWMGLAMLSKLHTTADTRPTFSAGGAEGLRLWDVP